MRSMIRPSPNAHRLDDAILSALRDGTDCATMEGHPDLPNREAGFVCWESTAGEIWSEQYWIVRCLLLYLAEILIDASGEDI